MDILPSDSPLIRRMTDEATHQLNRGKVMDADEASKFIHFVQSGYIKRYSITPEGGESIQVIYGPGDIFPLTPVFKSLYDLDIYHGPDTFYYEAMSDTRYLSLNLLSLKEAIQEDSNILNDLLVVSGTRLNSNIHQLENMSLRSTDKRIAHLLAYYAEKFSRRTPKGIAVLVPLTHQAIADSLNVARETVTRQMTLLEEQGIIIGEKPLIISDSEALKQVYLAE